MSDHRRGYGIPVLFSAIGLGNVAASVQGSVDTPSSAEITGFGMLIVAAVSAWSTHRARMYAADREANEKHDSDVAERRIRALEVKYELLKLGIPCELEQCPVVKIATGEMIFDEMPHHGETKPDRGVKCGKVPLNPDPVSTDPAPHDRPLDERKSAE